VIVSYNAGTGESTVATASDFIGGLSGTITTAATFTVTVRAAADAVTEPAEYFLLELRRGGVSGTLVATASGVMSLLSDTNASYNFTAGTLTPNWGDSISFTHSFISGSHATNTVFYFKILNWNTDDFNTQEVTRVLKGTSTTQTIFTVSTKSSLSKTEQLNLALKQKEEALNLVLNNILDNSQVIKLKRLAKDQSLTELFSNYLSNELDNNDINKIFNDLVTFYNNNIVSNNILTN
jgi:hypothetical protein